MTSAELLNRIRRQLDAAVDPEFREGALRFFKDEVALHGVRSPRIKEITAEAWREFRTWPRPAQNRLANELWKSGMMEEGNVAIYLYRRLARSCGACEFRLFERWIDRYVRNWAHCDGVSSWLIAAALANEPPLMDLLPPWTASPNRWKRRASAVSFLQEGKQGRNTERILDIADRLLGDSDDMVQKGVGWLLKETYPNKPREVVSFIEARKGRPSRLLLRYAAEKMKPGDRRTVLE
ncbi:MAG: DNA alkylation repair protein [Bryobacteraceae bacterium]|nr:DNA alkylation repair protein [Bryobacteraceae bacterium]